MSLPYPHGTTGLCFSFVKRLMIILGKPIADTLLILGDEARRRAHGPTRRRPRRSRRASRGGVRRARTRRTSDTPRP